MTILRVLRAAAIVALSWAAVPAAAQVAGGNVTVDGPWITLGDVTGTRGPGAAVRVAASPAPGARTMLNVAEVMMLAKENGVTWDARGARGIIVERSAAVVPRDVVLNALDEELARRAFGRSLRAEIPNANFSLTVPRNAPLTVKIENLDYDVARATFSATIVAPANGTDAQRTVVRGRVNEIVQIPVLVNTVAIGVVIRDTDIAWADMRTDRLTQGVALQPDQLVGYAPRRAIRPNEPVRVSDVQTPIVVAKGSNVTMIVEAPGIQLTAMGRALANGGLGDTVQVMNTQTHTTIEGVVEGPGRVRITTRRPIQQANAR